MNKLRDKLPNANKYCHIYTDSDGITNIHNTETNETFRIIPEVSALGIMIEKHKDGALQSRNSLDMDVLKVLADLAGSNDMILNLKDKGGEQLPEKGKKLTLKEGKEFLKDKRTNIYDYPNSIPEDKKNDKFRY